MKPKKIKIQKYPNNPSEWTELMKKEFLKEHGEIAIDFFFEDEIKEIMNHKCISKEEDFRRRFRFDLDKWNYVEILDNNAQRLREEERKDYYQPKLSYWSCSCYK